MSCNDNTKSWGATVVWSSGNINDWVFHPLGSPEPSTGVGRNMRPNLKMSQDSGNAKIRMAIRMTNDGLTFDTPVAIGARTRTGDGTSYGSAFSGRG